MATEVTSCRAGRKKIMLGFTMSLTLPVCTSKPQSVLALAEDLAGGHRTILAVVFGDLAQRGKHGVSAGRILPKWAVRTQARGG